MCIGVPMRVVSCGGGTALAIGRGEHARLDAMLIDDLRPGTWVLAFRGAAVRTMSEDEAAQTNAALDALAAAMGGDVATVEASFRDLIDRKPQLPAHLQGGRS
jgi:hydrogenase assembly chaperone HypC/HupF